MAGIGISGNIRTDVCRVVLAVHRRKPARAPAIYPVRIQLVLFIDHRSPIIDLGGRGVSRYVGAVYIMQKARHGSRAAEKKTKEVYRWRKRSRSKKRKM